MTTIHTVTITGADESVAPEELRQLSSRYPFVEWAILLSPKGGTSPRYPGRPWLVRLAFVARGGGMKIAAHLCGRHMRDLIHAGDLSGPSDLAGPVWAYVTRLQLNLAGQEGEVNIAAMAEGLKSRWAPPNLRQVILQGRSWEASRPLAEALRGLGVAVSLLHDASGGRGVMPTAWPRTLSEFPCGLAGGLSPESLPTTLPEILASAQGESVWIDMETGVRSGASREVFDLTRCEQVLQITQASGRIT